MGNGRITRVASGALLALMTSAATASQVGKCGGGGGTAEQVLSCPRGMHIIGVFVRDGMFTDRIGIRCGKVGDESSRRQWQIAGGSGGSGGRDSSCFERAAVTRIVMKSGLYVDRVTLFHCNEKPFPGTSNRTEDRTLTNNVKASCTLKCPTGEAMHSLTVRYGQWIDSVAASCRG